MPVGQGFWRVQEHYLEHTLAMLGPGSQQKYSNLMDSEGEDASWTALNKELPGLITDLLVHFQF